MFVLNAADIDYQQLQDLKLLLHGGFVHMDVDRRVCMVGCAFRIDFPYERDCEFVLKARSFDLNIRANFSSECRQLRRI